MPPLLERLREAWRRRDPTLALIWIVLTGLALYVVWRPRLLPMLDSANHLALARGWHDYNDPASHVADYYTLRIRVVPYYLFYGAIHLLLYVVPIEAANKIFLSAYLILFPLSVLAMARALGRSPWLALFGFPLLFTQNWIYGFASYLMSVTFAQLAFAALLRYLDTRRIGYALALGACTIVCYLGHVMPWFLFGLLAIAVLVLRWRDWQRGAVAATMMLPSVVMAITAVLDERGDHTYIKDAPFAGTFRDFPTAVLEFPRRVMELFPGNLDALVLAILTATLIGLAIWQRRTVKTPEVGDATRILRVCLWILGLAYLSLPYAISKPMSWWYVSPRLPAMMMIFVVLLPRVPLTGMRRLAMMPVVFCAIALPLKLVKLYRAFSGRNAAFMRLVEQLPRGAPTLVVVRNMMRGPGSEEKSGDPATSGPVYWHFNSWPMALKGGYSPFAFDQGIPIRPKNPLVTPSWGATDVFQFREAPKYDYYIVRDAPEEMDREPAVHLEKRLGDWSLYKRIYEFSEEP